MAFPTQSADLESTSNQYFSRADEALFDITGDLTMEGWVKFESTPTAGNEMVFMSKYEGVGVRSYELLLANNGGTLQLGFYTGDAGSKLVNWTPTTATWYHIAVAYDVDTAQCMFYVDGSQQGATQTTVTAIPATTANFEIGASSGINNLFDGRIVLARLWSVTRTASEINNNKCLILGSTANLVGEWTLDNTVTDNSGNGLTLTNNNAVVFNADVPVACTSSSVFIGYRTLTGVGI